MNEAFPLQWPLGYEVSKTRSDSAFKMTAEKARKELLKEIESLSGDKNPVISSNVPLRKDGAMYADMANDKIKEPGVAIYFLFNNVPTAIACDKWLTPAENLRALALTINAMRGMDRWGCSEILKRSFTGFLAIPESTSNTNSFWETLGLRNQPGDIDAVERHYKMKSKEVHPDVPGGSTEAFQQLQEAYKKAIAFFIK